MLLKDYLQTKVQNRRILIVSDLSRGQALVRKYEAMTGEMVQNVVCMNLPQMLNAVYIYMQSESGYQFSNQIIDQSEAVLLFRSIIFKNLKALSYFNEEKMLDYVTSKEIFDKANLIRSNGWTKEEEKVSNSRIADLKLLISEYENRLNAEKCMDQIAQLKYVITQMQKWEDAKQKINEIFTAQIACLVEETDCLSGLWQQFLELVLNGENNEIKLYETIPSIADMQAYQDKTEFFKGYGVFNECSYVANDILKKGVPYGSVTILYSSNTQLPAITSALLGNGMKVNIVSSYPAQDNIYLNLAKRILAWAQADYSEKALEKVMGSPAISIEGVDEEGKKINILAGQSYFDYINNAGNRREDSFALGWGYDRNLAFLKHEKEYTQKEQEKLILEMHNQLIHIFGDGDKPYDESNKVMPIIVYKKLVSFMEKYTISSKECAIGIGAMRELSNAIAYEDRLLSLKDILLFLSELLATVTIKDDADSSAIIVKKINDWILLDRPNVYMVGLSLKDMQASATESPVLSDEEMSSFLERGYIPTIKNEARQKEINLYRTLKSFTGEHIVFGFSCYDTVGFCQNNPSSFFREALKKLKGIDINALPEFVYGNPSGGVKASLPGKFEDKKNYDVKLSTSNSTMEGLLDCPKKYFYAKKMYIPENEYTECDYSAWLDAKLRGTFFHEIAEKYIKEKLIESKIGKYDDHVDEIAVLNIAHKTEEKLLLQKPAAFRKLADNETDDLIEASKAYLERLHIKLNETHWKVAAVEQCFEQAEYKIEDYETNSYTFVFTGIIDRIDYFIDEEAKTVSLRIVDYKTGKKESKIKEYNMGKLLQFVVYEKALMESGHYVDENKEDYNLLDYVKAKITQIEHNEEIKEWEFVFDSFNYVFPMENKDFEPMMIRKEDMEGINITRLKSILTALEDKKNYPDHMEFFEIVKEYVNTYGSTDPTLNDLYGVMERQDKNGTSSGMSAEETSHCQYCSYVSLCEHRKAGDF